MPPANDFSTPVILYKAQLFWRLQLDKSSVSTYRGSGEGKTGGRRYTKTFPTRALAEAWATDSILARKSEGYEDESQAANVSTSETGTTSADMNDNGNGSTNIVGMRRSSRKRAPPASFEPEYTPSRTTSSSTVSSAAKRVALTQTNNNTGPALLSASGAGSVPASSSVNASGSPLKKVKRSMYGQTLVNTSQRLGVVDPASGLSGTILTEKSDDQTKVYDVMLVLIDIAKNNDKYILMQLVDSPVEDKYFFFERWGRTGTSGQSLTVEYLRSQLDMAVGKFEGLFKQKAGLTWEEAQTQQPVEGKYRYVQQDYGKKTKSAVNPGQWQYWVDDWVDGKEIGWYNYDDDGNAVVEQLYLEYNANRSWLSQRIVKSGFYSYLVDLPLMTQTNVEHPARKVRNIRRVAADESAMHSNDINMGTANDNEQPPNDEPQPDTDEQKGEQKVRVKQETQNKKEKVKEETQAHSVQSPVTSGTAPSGVSGKVKKPISTRIAAKPQHKVEPVLSATVPSVPVKHRNQKVKKEEEVLSKESAQKDQIEISVDSHCPSASIYKVVGDRDATMNQTNIMGNNNNNKYYKMQLLEHKGLGNFNVWTRWGRVGEVQGAQLKMMGPFMTIELAEKAFNKKFREKAGYHWVDRATKEPIPGKYELLKIDHSEDSKQEEKIGENGDAKVESKLDQVTKELIQLLFQEDLYLDALKEFDIDVRRMPLGKLTTDQIEKGVTVLKEIEQKIQSGASSADDTEFQRLSSRFYTVLPHDFGRQRPPIINAQDRLQKCFDMCNVLRDVEKAKDMMNDATASSENSGSSKVRAKVDVQFDQLKSDMRLLEEGSEEMNMVRRAFEETKGSNSVTLQNAWRVERHGEAVRFQQMKTGINVGNHMLLWHGSHIGSISAILANGLRIMPHSGGRCGRGIYLATENNKSLGYTRPAVSQKIGCMFLAEATLGRVHDIVMDQFDLTKAPQGFHSVRACGRQSPPETEQVILDEVPVQVPVSRPVSRKNYKSSSFWQDEMVVYNEQQVRIRYVLSVRF